MANTNNKRKEATIMSAMHRSAIIIYEDTDKPVEVRIDPDHGTVWLSLNQLGEVFERDKSVISRHLKNIFNAKELDQNSVVAKIATTAADGKTYQVEYFNLDAIISVGYRVNSVRATRFRQWATRMLRNFAISIKAYSASQPILRLNQRRPICCIL
jgi:hypothetical protein